MIRGVHTMFYTSSRGTSRIPPDQTGFPRHRRGRRMAYLRSAGSRTWDATRADTEEGATSGTHAISLYCDDIVKTVAELKARGVEFTGEILTRVTVL